MKRGGNNGFTLIEILVAVFIVAIMFALGYGAISQAARQRERIAAAQDRLVLLQSTMRLLTQDFAQLQPRPVRDLQGGNWEPALLIDARRDVLARLTRGGWPNSGGLQRSNLQRVQYLLDNGTLVRLEWPVTDAAQNVLPRRRPLLDGVQSMTIRLMNDQGQWQSSWPPATATAASQNLRLRPIAVEIVIATAAEGELRRLIEVPG